MKRQALDLAGASPNVMVKCPGSAEGFRLVEELTAQGISTNATMSFSVSQHAECMNAVSRGLKKTGLTGKKSDSWRSVITHMSSRIGELGELQSQALAKNIILTPTDIRWAEIAIFKKAYHMGHDSGHPSKMLMCSMRIDHDIEPGRPSIWHMEKTAGSNAVFTCPPSLIAGLMEIGNAIPEPDPNAINQEIPQTVLDRLLKIPYFQKSYEFGGMVPHEFAGYASFERTAGEFTLAVNRLTSFVKKQFTELGRNPDSYE
jgi:transaldolase